METSKEHHDAWESFWRDAPDKAGEVFWDARPDLTAARHLTLFREHLPAGLPLVDVGCGNGTQTVFLAAHYRPVVGLDLSAAAVERARTLPGADRVDFRQGDAADPAAAERLHDELGDAHVYVRGVLHQSPEPARAAIAESLVHLLGERGRAFVLEPAAAAKDVLMGLMARPGGPPQRLAAIFGHGIAPMEMPDDAVPRLFTAAGLGVLASGATPLTTTEPGADGAPVELPSNWLVVGRNG
ncbi:class I SAM-dependent methyltransferase [Streptomyces sp. 549]|uniref:class I SAM-dependent methyltransferase n=1 Tax=Streptomyces sp. 549 TaxID=3049076 RepID=UPI0024C3CDCE|nr:class I SAM-dependent methyltransferase [Streptomyces sp. 549]MDK1472130.1 class I SAM-dependent methyltransferase [Streptomyces sp. 549]